MLEQHSFLNRFKNNKYITEQYDLIETFFNLTNIRNLSKGNLHGRRHLIAEGLKAVLNLSAKKEDAAYFNNLTILDRLSDVESTLYTGLTTSCTLKHATDAIQAILTSGKIQSVRSLEQNGRSADRHTPSNDGTDHSVFFVYGFGNHKTPKFLKNATHIISLNLNRMQQMDPATTQRLWVSGLVHDYKNETQYKVKIGNVTVEVQHKKDFTKTYRFIHPGNKTLIWKLNFSEEVFAGNDVLPGITLQFIFMLRLLGGEQNPLVNQLYKADPSSQEFISLAQKIFSALSPSWIYPEAKIIHQVDINREYVSIAKKQNPSTFEFEKFRVVENAVETGNFQLLCTLIKKNYPCYSPDRNNLLNPAIKISDPLNRHAIMKLLIENGVNGEEHFDNSGNRPIHEAAEGGTAEDLDLLLSSEYPDPEQPLIRYLSHPNLLCTRLTRYNDLIEIACNDFTTKKLQVLKKYGADFKKYGIEYFNEAIKAHCSNMNGNIKALSFLHQEGVTINDVDIWNETPLMTACRKGNIEIVKYLVEQMGVNVNSQYKFYSRTFFNVECFNSDLNGKTALHFAVEKGHTDIVTYLLQKGANPNALDLMQLDEAISPVDQSITKSQPKNLYHQKVAILVTGIKKNGQRYVILGQRCTDKQARICFPGGSASWEDSSLEAAALRELLEETSIDVRKIPQAVVTKLITIDGFKDSDHEATTFFLVDIANTPIKIHACDDFTNVKCVPLNQIKIDRNKPIAKYMQYHNLPILGSNALLIDLCLNNLNQTISPERKAILEKQLKIEEEGYYLLLDVISSTQEKKLSSQSPLWSEIIQLLDNGAHLSGCNLIHNLSLAMAMLEADCLEGITLLSHYGVSLNETSAGNINGTKTYQITPLVYSVAMNRMDMIKHLLSLGVTFDDVKMNQKMLEVSTQNNNADMLTFLLNQGLNPNLSCEELRGWGINFNPIISMAFKAKNLTLMSFLLKDNRIFLNRERSAVDRHTALMTAIDNDKKEAAFRLLATFRLDLTSLNKPKDYFRNQVTALEMSISKASWQDVASVIKFFLQYNDINEFLEKNNLPTMDGFVFIHGENNVPKIIFNSHDSEKIKKILHATALPGEIYQKEQQCYSPLDIHQLSNLFKDASLAQFLMNYTQESIIWSIRKNDLRKIQNEIICNAVSQLNPELFDSVVFQPQNEQQYYRQIVQENMSVNKILISSYSWRKPTLLIWFLDAIKNHDKIKNVKIVFDKSKDFDQSNHACLFDNIISCLLSLKNLAKIICENISKSELQILLDNTIKNTRPNCPEIVVEGNAIDPELAKQIILEKQMEFYSRNKNLAFSMKEILTTEYDTVVLKEYDNETNFIGKIAMQQAKPNELTIEGGNIDHASVGDFLRKNSSIQSISVKNYSEPKITTYLLEVINQSTAIRLKHLALFTCLNTQDIKELTKILQVQPIVCLKLHDAVITTEDAEVLSALGEAIAKNGSLEMLNIYDLKFTNDLMVDHFLLPLSKSRTLISLRYSAYWSTQITSRPGFKTLLAALEQNYLTSNSSDSDNNNAFITPQLVRGM